jgi:hypothetical protein
MQSAQAHMALGSVESSDLTVAIATVGAAAAAAAAATAVPPDGPAETAAGAGAGAALPTALSWASREIFASTQ